MGVEKREESAVPGLSSWVDFVTSEVGKAGEEQSIGQECFFGQVKFDTVRFSYGKVKLAVRHSWHSVQKLQVVTVHRMKLSRTSH